MISPSFPSHRLLLAMLLVGARRLRHVGYLEGDPVVLRFCGLKVLLTDRTLSRWLGQCTAPVRVALRALQVELLGLALGELKLPRLTIDVDGTCQRLPVYARAVGVPTRGLRSAAPLRSVA